MIKLIRYSLKSFLILLLISLFCLYILLFTQMGLRLAYYYSHKILPGQLRIEELSGHLATSFTLKKVSYSISNITIKIDKFVLDWFPTQLFYNKLSIQQANLQNVDIYLSTHNPPKNNKMTNWIRYLDIKQADINNLRIFKNNLLFSQIKTLSISPTDSVLNNFSISFPKGSIKGQYRFNDLLQRHWKLVASAVDVDTQYLWPHTQSIVSFDITSEGEWNQKNQNFKTLIEKISGNVSGYSLNGILDFSYDNATLWIKNADLRMDRAFIKMQGTLTKVWNFAWQVNLPNLNAIHSKLQGSIVSSGVILTQKNRPYLSGDISATNIKHPLFMLKAIKGKIDTTLADQANINVNLLLNELSVSNVTIPTLAISAKNRVSSNYSMRSEVTLLFNKLNSIFTTFNISNLYGLFKNKNILSGTASIHFRDINHITLLPSIKSYQGIITGKVNFSGPLNKIAFSGNLDLKNGQLSIPELKIQPHSIQLQTSFTQNLLVNLSGQFKSGNGIGFLQGSVNLNKNPYDINLTLKGNQILVANTSEYHITASPDLQITVQGEHASIKGNLLLPTVRVTRDNIENVVTLPEELEIVNETPRVHYFKNVSLGVNLILGRDAFIDLKELTAHIKGKLFAYQVPGGLPAGNGEFIISDGTYQAYNRTFNIKNGYLIYLGNLLTNPGLNIRAMLENAAQKKNFFGFITSSHAKVGLDVRGTLEDPNIQLFSEPPMSQNDILAQIVFGQSASSLSGFGSLFLLTNNINLNDSTSDNSSIGLLNPLQALNFSLPINTHWRIQTQTNVNETGIDILYEYETN